MKTHGMSDSPTYKSWRAMHQRCLYRGHTAYQRYGGRGIIIHPSWMRFENFLKDMGVRPNGTTLERRDNNGGYNKDNCCWATRMQQGQNSRANINLEYKGKSLCVQEWSRLTGLGVTTIFWRLGMGWPIERVLSRKKFFFKPTHCPQGHKYDANNTSINTDGSRRCKSCNRINQQRIRDNRIAVGLTTHGTAPRRQKKPRTTK